MTTTVFHRAAGLTIASDRWVPGLTAASAADPPDLVLQLGQPAPWDSGADARIIFVSPHTGPSGPVVKVDRSDAGYRFVYSDGTTVWLDSKARTAWCTWPDHVTLEDVATYLTGPIVGFALRLRGALALHASAVETACGALVLVGPHGAGKSTSAAALGRRGCRVIADDVVHVRPSGLLWLAEPFIGNIRLWASGAALALGAGADLPPLTPTWDKRMLVMGTNGIAAAGHPVRVGAVVFLESREAARSPQLEPLQAADAFVRLATHSTASHLLDASGRASEFRAIERLVRGVRCARSVAVESPDGFAAFIDLLQDWALQRAGAHAC